jgi:DNA gyrase subunit B
MANSEIMSIIATIGTGILDQFDIAKLRYNKIIILTDADQDGNHIFALLLTCFVKFFPELVRRGHIYRAFAPLYKVQLGRQKRYIKNEEEFQDFLAERFLQKNKTTIGGELVEIKQLQSIRKFCEEFEKKIPTREGDYKIILSICMLYERSGLQELHRILYETLGLNVSVCQEFNNISITVSSMFEKQVYNIENLQHSESDIFPITVNEKTFYDPISFLNLLNKSLYEDIDLQRYKGLGEMNADQLDETTLDPKNRYMVRLQPRDDEEFSDLVKRLLDVMGNESPRRELVLGYLGLENYSTEIASNEVTNTDEAATDAEVENDI